MKKLAIVLGILLGCSLCAYFYLDMSATSSEGTVAIVEQGGKEIYRIDLASVTDTTDYTLENENGTNTIRVSPEGIGIIEADCPDQTCVKMGLRSHGPQPIVCLPHKLTIRFETQEGDADFVTGN